MKKLLATVLLVCLSVCAPACPALAATSAELPITLAANPTTGYDWQIEYSEEGIAHLDGEFVMAEQSADAVGVGGRYDYTLLGDKEGSVTITLTYAQAWEEDSAITTIVVEALVDADLNVEIIGMNVGV